MAAPYVPSIPARRVTPAVVGPGYPTLAFDIVNPIQTDFLGIGAVDMAFMEFPEYGLSPEQKTAEYDRVRTSGMRLARTPVKTTWANPTFPVGSNNFSSADQGRLWTFCQERKNRGVNVVFTCGWHFPGSVCAIDLNGVTPSCVPGASDEDAWKQWVSSLLHEAINVRGFTNVVAVMFFTEPNNAVADPSATDPAIPVGYTAGEYYARLVTLARDQIAADDASRTPILPRIQLIGAEEHNYTGDPWMVYVKPRAPLTKLAKHAYEGEPPFGPLGLSAVNCADYPTSLARWQTWKADAAPLDLWSDEWNQLLDDPDTAGYRRTADAGYRLVNGLVVRMKAGVQAPFIWTFRDEKFEGSGGYTQKYGIKEWADTSAVKPSWYAVTMLANLCGGGNGTKVYNVVGGDTAGLHGVAVYVPPGDRWSTGDAGDWTFVVVNEGPNPQAVNVRLSQSLGGRTVYRYMYSGEIPPESAADPAYLLPWDMRFPGVAYTVPAFVVPARGVVAVSTMVTAAGRENLALSATATADSTGFGQAKNVNDGNFSNVVGSLNSWCKADNASHYVELTWAGSVTVGSVRLAFVGTTAGQVWADYATAGTPAPCADYSVAYWNGTTFVEVADVTGNTDPNRTHTFTPVSTTKIRLTVSSAATTGQVNQIGVYAT